MQFFNHSLKWIINVNTYAEPIQYYCIVPQTFMNLPISYHLVRERDYLHFTDEELRGKKKRKKQKKNPKTHKTQNQKKPTDDLNELFQEIWQIKFGFLQSQSTALKTKILLIISRNLNFQLAKKYKRNETWIHVFFQQWL